KHALTRAGDVGLHEPGVNAGGMVKIVAPRLVEVTAFVSVNTRPYQQWSCDLESRYLEPVHEATFRRCLSSCHRLMSSETSSGSSTPASARLPASTSGDRRRARSSTLLR